MSYLVRRLLENTSNEGFLRAKFSDNVSAAQLAARSERTRYGTNGASLRPTESAPGSLHPHNGATRRHAARRHLRKFAAGELRSPQSQEKMRAALARSARTLGQKYPLVIDGEKIWTDNTIASINPSNPDQVVGSGAEAEFRKRSAPSPPRAKRSIRWCRVACRSIARNCSSASPPSWTAGVSSFPRSKFSKWARPWAEADGDIREAIDFCLFYAHQMRLHRSPATDPARARRRKLSALLAARRRPRHRALEFSDRDS